MHSALMSFTLFMTSNGMEIQQVVADDSMTMLIFLVFYAS